MYNMYQMTLVYGTYFLLLFPIVSAGILFFKTRTKATATFFFGLLISVCTFPFVYLLTKAGLYQANNHGLFTVIVLIASFASCIGFLVFVLSLPKR